MKKGQFIFELLLVTFLLLFLCNGIIAELITLALLVFFWIKRRKNIFNVSYIECCFIFIICSFILLNFFQVAVNHLNIRSMIRLRGLTRSVLAPVITFLIFYPRMERDNHIGKILTCYLIILNLGSLVLSFNHFFTNTAETFTTVIPDSSSNYLGAINCVSMPFLLYKIKDTYKFQNKFIYAGCYLLEVAVCIMSGGRLATALTAAIFGFIILREYRLKEKLMLFFASLPFLALSIYIIINNETLSKLVKRGFSIFTHLDNWDRILLYQDSIYWFKESSGVIQWIGNGEILFQRGKRLMSAHMFVLEILNGFGIIGILLVGFIIISIMLFIIKLKSERRIVPLLTFGIYLITCLINPFMLTGYLLGTLSMLLILETGIQFKCEKREK